MIELALGVMASEATGIVGWLSDSPAGRTPCQRHRSASGIQGRRLARRICPGADALGKNIKLPVCGVGGRGWQHSIGRAGVGAGKSVSPVTASVIEPHPYIARVFDFICCTEHIRGSSARNDDRCTVRPRDSQRVVSHLASPSNGRPSSCLGRHDLQQYIKWG